MHMLYFSIGETIFRFLCTQVMWQHVEHLIAGLNRDRQSSLKVRGYVAHFYSSVNCFKNDLISAVHQKSYNN